jgi:hypothetical protein
LEIKFERNLTMFNSKKSLPRRTFLRGTGAVLALPLLDAMIPANTAWSQTPAVPVRRFGAMYVPHGAMMDRWTPVGVGKGFDFSPILQPLEPLAGHINVISGVSSARTLQEGGHAVAPAAYLSGHTPKQTEGADISAATTIDQVIAKTIGQDTLFPSLEVATEDFSTSVGACDVGFSCQYMNTISWAGPTTPLPMETNPRIVFERMFGGTGTPEQRAARIRGDRSILDAVMKQLPVFESGLGSQDRARVDEYLQTIREIERRLQKAEQQASDHVVGVESPIGPPELYDEHVAILFDLMAAAFQADITRVFTFMMARDVTNISFPQIGVPDPHHALSHESHRGDAEKEVKFAKVNTHHVQMVGRFLQKLNSTKDGEGTLLDHSLILYGSGMSNGNQHSHHPLPLLVAGRAAGRVEGHRHLIQRENTPIGNLLLAMAQKTGVQIDSFGDNNGVIEL